jgi:flagellar assembly protein FliH
MPELVGFDFEQLEPPEALEPEGIVARAVAEADDIRAHAHAEGVQAGRAEAGAEVAQAVQALGEAAAAVQALGENAIAGLEQQAVRLALDLAGKILAGALQARPELVVEVVQGALRRVNDRRQMIVLLNPDDIDLVAASIGDEQGQVGALQQCDLQADQRIEPGGAIVRTVEGEVDACVSTQLERAREVVASALEAGEPDP